MANPEIDIKMNIVPPNIDDIKKRIAEIAEDAKSKEKELSKFSSQAIEMSEAVQIMLERAKASGKANVEETLTSELSSVGLENALSMGEKVEKSLRAFSGLPTLLDNVLKKAEAGSITLEQAAEQVERYSSLLQNIDNSQLEGDVGLLNYDLENASDLDEVLAMWERLSRQADENAEASRKLEEAAKARSHALLAEKEALDENSAGYQKQASELIKSSIRFEEVGERAASQAAKFDTFKKKLLEALSGVDSNEGTKKALELFKEYEAALNQQASKTEKVAKQLEATDNDRIERMRKAEADAQKAEEQAQKRAESEEKRVQKQEDIAQREKFAMELVGKSRQELIETIKKLTEAQKKASEAEDKVAFKQYTLQIAAARHQLERLRGTTNLSRIAMMQQFQTAQQLGQSFRALVDTVTNFGEAAENGTLNLSGLTSSIMSVGYAVKAGLGPIAWAMAAVELLTSAWNMYAAKQKEVEAADKKRQERASKLVTAYHDAAAAAKEFHEEEERKFVLEKTQEWYANLNKELSLARDYTNEIYRNEQARLTLLSKEDELEFALERNKIQREYIAGLISEQQRDEQLDALNVKKAQRKAVREEEDNDAKIQKAFVEARDAQDALKNAEQMLATEQKGRRYSVNVFDAEKYYTIAEGMKNRFAARAFLEEKLGQYAPEDFERYERLHKAENERIQVAENAVKALKDKVDDANELHERAKKDAEASAKLNEQAITHAKALAEDNKETRSVIREANERKEAQKKADALATKTLRDAQENEKVFEEAYWQLDKNNKNRLRGSEAKDLQWLLNKGVPDALDGKMSKENLSKVAKLYEKALATSYSTDNELVQIIAKMLDITKIKNKRLQGEIAAIKRNGID